MKYAGAFFLLSVCFFTSLSARLVEEFIFEEAPGAFCHASTLTETPSHELLCAYSSGSVPGADDVGIWISKKSGGKWGESQLIAKENGTACWDPVLFSFPFSKEILLFYRAGEKPSSWSGFIKRSYDEGAHWTFEEPLPAGVIGPVRTKPLFLENGSLLCGSSIETWHRWGCWVDIFQYEEKMWSKSSPINLKGDYFGIIQPALFVKGDGTLALLARPYHARAICLSTSKDGGKTWSETSLTNLPNPNSPIDVVRLKGGLIVLAYNHSTSKRTPLNLAISRDGGDHWEPSLVLEDQDGAYCYPSIIQTEDGLIHITYSYNYTKINHVVLDPSDLEENR